MIVRFDADCERFRAQLAHFIYVYGFSARRLGGIVSGLARLAPEQDSTRVSGRLRRKSLQ